MSDGRAAGRRAWAGAALLYLWSVVPALFGAMPLGLLVGGLWGHQGGDALLWEAGGFHLIETVRLLGARAGALLWGLPWLLLGWSLLGLAPLALVLSSLRDEGDAAGQRLSRALSSLSPLILIAGVALLVRVAIVLLCILAWRGLDGMLSGATDPSRDLARGTLALLALLLTSLIRITQDLCAAAAVGRGERGTEALLSGLEALHRSFPAAVGAWLWRALVGLAAVALAAALGGRGHAGLALLAAVLAHQGSLLALARLRVGWLRRALALTRPRSTG